MKKADMKIGMEVVERWRQGSSKLVTVTVVEIPERGAKVRVLRDESTPLQAPHTTWESANQLISIEVWRAARAEAERRREAWESRMEVRRQELEYLAEQANIVARRALGQNLFVVESYTNWRDQTTNVSLGYVDDLRWPQDLAALFADQVNQ